MSNVSYIWARRCEKMGSSSKEYSQYDGFRPNKQNGKVGCTPPRIHTSQSLAKIYAWAPQRIVGEQCYLYRNLFIQIVWSKIHIESENHKNAKLALFAKQQKLGLVFRKLLLARAFYGQNLSLENSGDSRRVLLSIINQIQMHSLGCSP